MSRQLNRYAGLVAHLRDDPHAFKHSVLALQRELEREARETVRVMGVRVNEGGRDE